MRILFTFAAIAFLAMSLWYAWRRPGFLGAAFMGSYGLAALFGPSGSALGLAALASTFSIWAMRPASQFTSPPPELALLAWAFLTAVSYITVLYPDISGTYVKVMVGLAGTAFLMGRTYGDQRTFIRDFVIGSIVVLLICVPVVASSANSKGDLTADQNSVGLGAILEVPVVACMALLMFAPELKRKWRWAVAAVIFLIALPFMAMLGNRSSLLAAFVVFLFFFVLRMRRPRAMRVVLITITALIIVVGLGILALLQLQTITGLNVFAVGIQRLVMNFTIGNAGHTYVDPSASSRLLFYREAFSLILEAPILGHGVGTFGYIADYAGMDSYPHNMFLEILVNNGLLGLVLFLLGTVPLGLYSLKRAWPKNSNWQSVFLAGMLLETLVRLQVSMTIFSAKGFFFAIGMLAAQWAADMRKARTAQDEASVLRDTQDLGNARPAI